MAKLSITLPNSTQITLESDEPEIIHEVVGMVLRELPQHSMNVGENSNGAAAVLQPNVEKGTGLATDSGSAFVPLNETQAKGAAGTSAAEAPTTRKRRKPTQKSTHVASDPDSQSESPNIPGVEDPDGAFTDFCFSATPMGDMRRVVVAAVGAERFLGIDSVDATNLAGLFDLAGWRLPHSFTQTLRNAARGKFRWMEKMPGRSGRYTATQLGLRTTLGE